MGIKKELGQKIKRMRVKRKMTQEELAEKVNISLRTLGGIETGENFLTAETLDKIVEALNTTLEELFNTSHLKESSELIKEITKGVDSIKFNREKLEHIYKFIKYITNE